MATASSGKASLTSAGKDESSNDEEVNSATKASATAALAEIAKVKAKLAAIGRAKEALAKTPSSANKKISPDHQEEEEEVPFFFV